jgi:hypothetical protein
VHAFVYYHYWFVGERIEGREGRSERIHLSASHDAFVLFCYHLVSSSSTSPSSSSSSSPSSSSPSSSSTLHHYHPHSHHQLISGPNTPPDHKVMHRIPEMRMGKYYSSRRCRCSDGVMM